MTTNRYRKRPIEVEAFQITEAHRADNSTWPQWLNRAWNREPWSVNSVFPLHGQSSDGADPLVVMTLGGPLDIEWDYWIISGIEGELYLCNPNIFILVYEQVIS